ncbi:hypothetical protein FQV27_09855 [Paracoccus aurantiacus]|uniref:Transcription factor zinc-finger domain-containing protein n=1 Tax=Paracoccus aurantiacus TaxID=2599412 RepID=A0A5C6S6K0_9RHOB|nr:zf-TFIIB domain-containing protein [Paracoccus aurantiacus]TXB69254.1 hypothetical protein FQV27_09855 [Paracoccus aurantiacus]
MKCPVDNETLLMTQRDGVEIDYCPKCRGVWLDRGELDKIIDRSAATSAPPVRLAEPAGQPAAPRPVDPSLDPYAERPHTQRYDSRDDRRDGRRDDRRDRRRYDDDDDDEYRYRGKRKKRESFLSELFDF